MGVLSHTSSASQWVLTTKSHEERKAECRAQHGTKSMVCHIRVFSSENPLCCKCHNLEEIILFLMLNAKYSCLKQLTQTLNAQHMSSSTELLIQIAIKMLWHFALEVLITLNDEITQQQTQTRCSQGTSSLSLSC